MILDLRLALSSEIRALIESRKLTNMRVIRASMMVHDESQNTGQQLTS